MSMLTMSRIKLNCMHKNFEFSGNKDLVNKLRFSQMVKIFKFYVLL